MTNNYSVGIDNNSSLDNSTATTSYFLTYGAKIVLKVLLHKKNVARASELKHKVWIDQLD